MPVSHWLSKHSAFSKRFGVSSGWRHLPALTLTSQDTGGVHAAGGAAGGASVLWRGTRTSVRGEAEGCPAEKSVEKGVEITSSFTLGFQTPCEEVFGP